MGRRHGVWLWVMVACGAGPTSPMPQPAEEAPAVEVVEAGTEEAPPAALEEATPPSAEPPRPAAEPPAPVERSPAPARVATTPLPPRPAKPVPSTKGAPLSKAPPELFACESSADCVVSCDIPGGCCLDQCGCRTAVNRHVLEALKEQPWATCDERCPAVGCMREEAHSATCVQGRCRAQKGGALGGL